MLSDIKHNDKRLWLCTGFGLLLLLSASTAQALSEEKELEIGKQMHGQILARFGVYPDPGLQQYVNDIGQKLAAVSDRNHLEFSFYVLDDDVVNAMALPGGYIYITRGLLAHLSSEAELASVLGHEIGHVDARHASKRDTSQKVSGVLSAAAAIAARSPIAGQAANMAGGAAISSYSRKQELEADGLGAKYLAKTGYPTESVIRTVEILKRREQFEIERARIEDREPNVGHGLYATHPDNDKRFEEAVESANQYKVANLPYDENTDAFLDRMNGLRWGPKRAPGTFRNNWYYNSKLGVKMKFPDGWRVNGEPGNIEAVASDNNAVMQVVGVVPGRKMTAEEVLRRKLGLDSFRELQAITVSGMPGVLAVADRWVSPFGPRPVRAAVVMDNRKRQAFVFAGSGRHDLNKIASDQQFISTIFSFDHMTREEMPLGLPPRVKVVRAEDGTTVEDLAAMSSIPVFAEQQIRLINGLYPRGEPQAGQLVKVID